MIKNVLTCESINRTYFNGISFHMGLSFPTNLSLLSSALGNCDD